MKNLFIYLFLSCALVAQDRKPLSLQEIIQLALKNNTDLQKVRYDLSVSDSDYLKSQSKYDVSLKSDASFLKSKIKTSDNNSSLVDKSTTDTLSGGLSKIYKTATTVGVTAITERKDNNKGEDLHLADGNISPPIFTGTLKFELSQEILKNAFGSQDQNNDVISKNKTEIKKLQLRQTAANTISKIIINYWNYIVKSESVKTYEELYQNTLKISRLVKAKNKIGLSKNYEVNQWNFLLQQAQNKISKAKIDQDNHKREIARELNLDERDITIKVETFTDLITLPLFSEDLKEAYKNRRDYQELEVKNQNSKLIINNNQNNLLPSLKLNASVSSKNQNYQSHSDNFLKSPNITSFRYKEVQSGASFLYPLTKVGAKAALKESQIALKKNHLDQENLKNKIYNEILNKRETIKVNHEILGNSQKALFYSEKYYKGLLKSYNMGTGSSLEVKNALDSIIQNHLSLTQAKVQYSISVIQYYLVKNTLLKYFGIYDKF